jgi:hypothetical protein
MKLFLTRRAESQQQALCDFLTHIWQGRPGQQQPRLTDRGTTSLARRNGGSCCLALLLAGCLQFLQWLLCVTAQIETIPKHTEDFMSG